MNDSPSNLFIFLVFTLVVGLCVLILSSLWKLYKKAGFPGWAAIIPYYNYYTLYKMVWGNGWLFLILFIPCANMIFEFITWFYLAKCFGKQTGFAICCLFFPIVCVPILAFDDNAQYIGPANR